MKMKNNENIIEESAVSPVIATILMVAITVVLAGVLYVWANNLASEGTDTSMNTLNTYTVEDAADEASVGTDDTFFFEPAYPITLVSNGDTIQVENEGSTVAALNVIVLGDKEA